MDDSTQDDLLAAVEERAANPPKIWDPEKKLDRDDVVNDTSVSGIIEDLDERESGFGAYKTTVLRRRDGSRVSVAWFGTVLENRSKNLAVGDAVAISFLGRVKPRDPDLGEYANYDVVHRKPASGPRPVLEEPNEEPPEDLPMPEDADAGAA